MTAPATLDFPAARQAVQNHLDDLYADGPEHPTVLPYGFDTGAGWAPLVDWDGVMGVYVWLVDKSTGQLTPKSFPEFEALPDPKRVGAWPADLTA